jgi:hypothetical protein
MTFYYGSTTKSILHRYDQHRNLYSDIYSDRSSKFYSHYDAIGWDKTHIRLIEEVSVRDKLELKIIEAKYILSHISNHNCLNTNIPIHLPDFNINPHKFIITSTQELYNIITTKINNKQKLYDEYASRNDISNMKKYQIWAHIVKERAGQRIADTLKKNIHCLAAKRFNFLHNIYTIAENHSSDSEGFKVEF